MPGILDTNPYERSDQARALREKQAQAGLQRARTKEERASAEAFYNALLLPFKLLEQPSEPASAEASQVDFSSQPDEKLAVIYSNIESILKPANGASSLEDKDLKTLRVFFGPEVRSDEVVRDKALAESHLSFQETVGDWTGLAKLQLLLQVEACKRFFDMHFLDNHAQFGAADPLYLESAKAPLHAKSKPAGNSRIDGDLKQQFESDYESFKALYIAAFRAYVEADAHGFLQTLIKGMDENAKFKNYLSRVVTAYGQAWAVSEGATRNAGTIPCIFVQGEMEEAERAALQDRLRHQGEAIDSASLLSLFQVEDTNPSTMQKTLNRDQWPFSEIQQLEASGPLQELLEGNKKLEGYFKAWNGNLGHLLSLVSKRKEIKEFSLLDAQRFDTKQQDSFVHAQEARVQSYRTASLAVLAEGNNLSAFSALGDTPEAIVGAIVASGVGKMTPDELSQKVGKDHLSTLVFAAYAGDNPRKDRAFQVIHGFLARGASPFVERSNGEKLISILEPRHRWLALSTCVNQCVPRTRLESQVIANLINDVGGRDGRNQGLGRLLGDSVESDAQSFYGAVDLLGCLTVPERFNDTKLRATLRDVRNIQKQKDLAAVGGFQVLAFFVRLSREANPYRSHFFGSVAALVADHGIARKEATEFSLLNFTTSYHGPLPGDKPKVYNLEVAREVDQGGPKNLTQQEAVEAIEDLLASPEKRGVLTGVSFWARQQDGLSDSSHDYMALEDQERRTGREVAL